LPSSGIEAFHKAETAAQTVRGSRGGYLSVNGQTALNSLKDTGCSNSKLRAGKRYDGMSSPQEMISGKNIIIISGTDWDPLWQASQEIASRLARAGNRVLYIENLGLRAPSWQDKKRVAGRITQWLTSLLSHGVRQVEKDLYVCSPIVVPPFAGRRWRGLNRRLLVPLIAKAARKVGKYGDTIIWTFLPTDTVLDLIDAVNERSVSTVIYHCTADFSELTPGAPQLQENESKLLRMSDLVFTTCRQLAERCSPYSDSVRIFSNGVSPEIFNGDDLMHPPPDASLLSSITHPIIGYVGGLHRFVDYELLTRMARQRPNWSWVFVGPIQTSINGLGLLPNVHMLGRQPHGQLGHYLRSFDVCIIPYLKNSATATVVPTKVNEYLAAGKPVVSTELPTICDFNKQHEILVTASSSPEAFLKAIEESLHLPTDEETIARRTEVAKSNDWQIHLDNMSRFIEAKMQARAMDAAHE